MLKTLTEYFNTLANTGFGCLECSPEELLPGHGRTCRGLQGFVPSGICAFRDLQELRELWEQARTRGSASLLCSVNTRRGVEPNGSSRSCPGLQGWRWQRAQSPWRSLHPPLPASRAVPSPAPARRVPQPHCPGTALLPWSLLCPKPREKPAQLLPKPHCQRALGSATGSAPQRAAGKCPNQCQNCASTATAGGERKAAASSHLQPGHLCPCQLQLPPSHSQLGSHPPLLEGK